MTRELHIYSGRNRPALAPLYRIFEQLTGARIKVTRISHHDVLDRILAEGGAPKADLLITNTQVKPELYRAAGIFEPYRAPVAQDYDDWLRAPDFAWVAITAWPRSAMVNEAVLPDPADAPTRIADLLEPRFADRFACASIQEAMTTAYLAALRATRGDEFVTGLVDGLIANGLRVHRANIDVREALVRDRLAVTLANSSNLHVFRHAGNAVREAWLDQEEGGLGTNVETHTAAVLKGARAPELARAFIDFILSVPSQEYLARFYGETPVNPAANPGYVRPLHAIRRTGATLAQVAQRFDSTAAFLRGRGFDMGGLDDPLAYVSRGERRRAEPVSEFASEPA